VLALESSPGDQAVTDSAVLTYSLAWKPHCTEVIMAPAEATKATVAQSCCIELVLPAIITDRNVIAAMASRGAAMSDIVHSDEK
jgi:hypothetical protein